MGRVRSEVIARMGAAYKRGVSASRFILAMKERGLSYRRTDMLADWRSVSNIKKVEGAARFVRKDRRPSEAVIAEVDWKLSREFMYKVKTQSRLKPGEPITERFVNIMADSGLTILQIEEQVRERWGEWEKYAPEELVSLQVFTAVHRSSI